jgi:hypothetical protein
LFGKEFKAMRRHEILTNKQKIHYKQQISASCLARNLRQGEGERFLQINKQFQLLVWQVTISASCLARN